MINIMREDGNVNGFTQWMTHRHRPVLLYSIAYFIDKPCESLIKDKRRYEKKKTATNEHSLRKQESIITAIGFISPFVNRCTHLCLLFVMLFSQQKQEVPRLQSNLQIVMRVEIISISHYLVDVLFYIFPQRMELLVCHTHNEQQCSFSSPSIRFFYAHEANIPRTVINTVDDKQYCQSLFVDTKPDCCCLSSVRFAVAYGIWLHEKIAN